MHVTTIKKKFKYFYFIQSTKDWPYRAISSYFFQDKRTQLWKLVDIGFASYAFRFLKKMILRYLKKCFHYTFQTTLLEAPCLMWVCYYQSAEKYFLQMNYNIFTALLGIIIDLYSLLALCHMQEFHNESEINKSFCSCCLSGFSFSGAFLEISCICRISCLNSLWWRIFEETHCCHQNITLWCERVHWMNEKKITIWFTRELLKRGIVVKSFPVLRKYAKETHKSGES